MSGPDGADAADAADAAGVDADGADEAILMVSMPRGRELKRSCRFGGAGC
ncbi:hypothetical protein [Haloferula sp.]